MTDHPIPYEALDTHIAVLGKTGAGKSYTARGLVERLLQAQRHVVIIDPTGAWWGLRTGFDIPIFGGRHGDIEISDKTGEAVAAVIAEQRTSAIVDLSLLSGGAQRRFMRDFAHRLRAKEPGAIYLVIDEADEFLPQNLQPDMTNLFGDLKWMVRRGRLNGFRVMMITQRPAEIAKAVLTQIETLVAHRLTAPQDRKAIEEWVKGHHDPSEAREVLTTLASLDKGEAWVWSPDLGLLTRSRMPAITTFDSGRTPEPGETAFAPPELEQLDLSAIEVALATAEGEQIEQGAIAKYRADQARAAWPDLRADLAAMTADRDNWKHHAEVRLVLIERARAALQANGDESDTPEPFARKGGEVMEGDSGPRAVPDVTPARGAGLIPEGGSARKAAAATGAGGDLAPRHKRILDAIAWTCAYLRRTEAERNIVAWIADISPKSSSYTNDLGALRTRGLVTYPSPGALALTDAGRDVATVPTTPSKLADLWRAISSKLQPRHIRIVEALFKLAPATRKDVADRAGISATSSSYTNDLGYLRTLGLIDYPGPGLLSLGKVLS